MRERFIDRWGQAVLEAAKDGSGPSLLREFIDELDLLIRQQRQEERRAARRQKAPRASAKA